jgi:DNA-binding phage protein
MKRNRYALNNMTIDDIDKSGLLKISKEPLNSIVAKSLTTPAKLKKFKEAAIEEFNETKEIGTFLESLKVIAIAEEKIDAGEKKTNIERSNIYRALSNEKEPCISKLINIAHNLGIDFKAISA